LPNEWDNTGEKNYVMGYEESIGYNVGTFLRDKDGVINFTKLSKKKSDKKPSNPIDKLVLTSARINYEDYSFPDKLEKKIEQMKRRLAGEPEPADIEYIEEVLDKKEKEEKKKSDTIQWAVALLLVVFLFAGGYGYMWYQDKVSKAKAAAAAEEQKRQEEKAKVPEKLRR